MPALPVLAIVSCTVRDNNFQAKALKALDQEAKELSESNFYYEDKPFDFTRASTNFFDSREKITGVNLSKGTTMEIHGLSQLIDSDYLTANYRLKKNGITSHSHEFTFYGPKTILVRKETKAAKKLLDKIVATNINDKTKNIYQVKSYTSIEEFISKTTLSPFLIKEQNILDKVSLSIKTAFSKESNTHSVEFTIFNKKYNYNEETSVVFVIGFKALTTEDINKQNKAKIDAFKASLLVINEVETNETITSSVSTYESIKDFIFKTKINFPKWKKDIKITISTKSSTATQKVVTLTISKGEAPNIQSVEHEITVKGFKAVT